jgi:hypothetical protein
VWNLNARWSALITIARRFDQTRPSGRDTATGMPASEAHRHLGQSPVIIQPGQPRSAATIGVAMIDADHVAGLVVPFLPRRPLGLVDQCWKKR